MRIQFLLPMALSMLIVALNANGAPECTTMYAEKYTLSPAASNSVTAFTKNKHKEVIVARAPICPPPPPPGFITTPTQNPNALSNAFFPNPLATNLSALPPQTVGVNFVAGSMATNPLFGGTPPDSMGVVGPEQFYFSINQGMVIFDKLGNKLDLLDVEMPNFFNLDGDFSFFVDASDPHLYYDKFTDRFYFIIGNFDRFSNQFGGFSIMMSDTGIISNNTQWTIVNIVDNIIIPDINGCPGDQGLQLDFPTIGVDQNAIYIGANMFNNNPWIASSIFVIQKESLLNDGPIFITAFRDVTGFTGWVDPFRDASSTLQPLSNPDTNPKFGYFIAQDPTMFGKLNLYRIANSGSTSPSISSQIPIDVLTTFSIDADATVAHPTFPTNFYGVAGVLDPQDDRLNACIRNKQLFAAQVIVVNANGIGSFSGDRTAIRWYQFDLTGDDTGNGLGNEQLNTIPVLIQAGTLWDATPVNPIFYYMPSIMVNKRGDLSICGTLSGANQPISAFFVGRLTTDPLGALRIGSTVTDRIFATGSDTFTRSLSVNNKFGQRWGDYSFSSLDPADDMTIWTVQEIARNGLFVNVVAQLLAPTL